MSTEKLKSMINEYFDGELKKESEPSLFTLLSEDLEAREYFKDLNQLRNTIDYMEEEYPDKLDEKVMGSINQIVQHPSGLNIIKYNLKPGVSYLFALILLALSIFFYSNSMKYQNQLELTYQQINQQNQMIQVLFNSLPQTEVKASFANEIIVTPSM